MTRSGFWIGISIAILWTLLEFCTPDLRVILAWIKACRRRSESVGLYARKLRSRPGDVKRAMKILARTGRNRPPVPGDEI